MLSYDIEYNYAVSLHRLSSFVQIHVGDER